MRGTTKPDGASPREPAGGDRLGGHLDGRLDLDDLERPLDLDVIGEDDARVLFERLFEQLSERLGTWFEQHGVAPFLRRHRSPVLMVAAATTVALVAGGLWWTGRPAPLPGRPLLVVTTIGPDQTQARLDVADGSLTVTGLTLSVTVASVERPGVRVELLSVTGPGLRPSPGAGPSVVDTTRPDEQVSVAASVDCAAPGATSAVLGATADDYGIEVRRTSPEGESRVDRVALVGGQHLRHVLREACLQSAADRELSVLSLSAAAVRDVAAADVVVTVSNTSASTWHHLQASSLAQPEVVGSGPSSDLVPGGTAKVRVRLWPEDCSHPARLLTAGLAVRSSPAGAEDSDLPAVDTTFRLALDARSLASVATAFAASCGTEAPRATVERAFVRQPDGSTSTDATSTASTSAGSLELTVGLRSPGTFAIQVDDSVSTAAGRLTALDDPVHLERGAGTLHLLWELPSCTSLLRVGRPRLSVHLVQFDTDVRRPYLLDLDGEPMRGALIRLCGASSATTPVIDSGLPVS